MFDVVFVPWQRTVLVLDHYPDMVSPIETWTRGKKKRMFDFCIMTFKYVDENELHWATYVHCQNVLQLKFNWACMLSADF